MNDFDMTKTDDLPDELKPKDIDAIFTVAEALRWLGEAGEPVSAREIAAAIYRRTQKVVPIQNISIALARATREKKCKRVTRGRYSV